MISLKDLTIGQYVDTQSVIHRLDPRSKFLAVCMCMIGIMATGSLPVLSVFILICIGLSFMAKVPPSHIIKNLRPFTWLFVMTFGIHLFFTEGRSLPLLPFFGIHMTVEGASRGLFFSLRLMAFILTAALFTLTTSPIELTDGLEKLLKPLRRLRVPVHEIAMIVTIALRFVPTLIDEADRLRKAQLARGVRFSGSLRRRIHTLIPFFVPLFLSAFRRADELADAMDARCYRGGEGRTHFRELRLKRKDGLALVLTGCLCLGVSLIT